MKLWIMSKISAINFLFYMKKVLEQIFWWLLCALRKKMNMRTLAYDSTMRQVYFQMNNSSQYIAICVI